MLKRLSYLIAVLFICFTNSSYAVVLATENVRSVFRSSKNIYVIRILSGKLNREDEGFACGFMYEANIENNISNGKSKKRVTFIASESLALGGGYVLLDIPSESLTNRKAYDANCGYLKIKGLVFWAALGDRIFEVDGVLSRYFGEEVAALNRSAFNEDKDFISPADIPDEYRGFTKSNWFIKVKSIVDIQKGR